MSFSQLTKDELYFFKMSFMAQSSASILDYVGPLVRWLGYPLSHDPLLHASLCGPKRVRLVISDLNRVVTLVEGISVACEE
jgi:hypothetical protein